MSSLVISASPRAQGRSAVLARAVCDALAAAAPAPDVRPVLISLADLDIHPCIACDACACGPNAPEALPCAIDDDMARVRTLMDACEDLVIVAPVYFAGAPAQLKALLDRLQPYFWTDWLHAPKRPAQLHVVGEGTDPHGFAPLVASARSALAVAGFRLGEVHDWVGLIPDDPPAIPAGVDVLSGGRVHPADAYRCEMPAEPAVASGAPAHGATSHGAPAPAPAPDDPEVTR